MARYPEDEFDDPPATERKGAHRRSSGALSQTSATALVVVLALIAALLVFGAVNIIRSSATDPETQVAQPEETEQPTEDAAPEDDGTSVDVVEKTATVTVLNASGVTGAGAVFGSAVEDAGWELGEVGNFATADSVSSIHYSAPEFELQANALAELLGVTEVIQSADFDGDITVVICSDIANDPPAGGDSAQEHPAQDAPA